MTLRLPHAPVAAALLTAAALAGCSEDTSTPRSAFSQPIDFSYACEGDGQTQAPDNDERASSFIDTRMCPDVQQGPLGGATTTVEGDLFAVVLNRLPAGLIVVQLNPAAGARNFLDADAFVPGVSPIPVGEDPIRLLRDDDWSAFYVLEAGDPGVTRVVIEGFYEYLDYTTTRFELPGVPADGVTLPGKLVVVASDVAELWIYDLEADPVAPPLTVVPLSDVPAEVVRHGDDLLVTWLTRPVLTRLTVDGVVVDEVGLAPACRDTLDNDGDGLADRDDPDCADAWDDDEGEDTGEARVADLPEAAAGFDAGAALCGNGVDDDGDGFTDYPDDPACADADDDGEGLPGCADGVDDDGDGFTDYPDDASCYAAYQRAERRLPAEGPFHATVIEGGDAGTFVYVLDQRIGEILVFEEDAADGTLARVDVHAADASPPDIEYVPVSNADAEPTISKALAAVRAPALARRGAKNIQLYAAPAAMSLSSSRVRGEIWERIIAPEAAGEAPTLPRDPAGWTPSYCAPGTAEDVCQQPAGDDETWYAYAARTDGRIQQVEVIRRGVPVHRLTQRYNDPADRVSDVSAPRLTLRGNFVASRGEPQAGYAFIGAGIEELLDEAVDDESSRRLRRFGVWPAADQEQVLSESWTLTYEGEIPGTRAHLGRMLDDATLFDAAATFCEDGVAAGDWLQLEVPWAGSAEALRHTLEVVTSDGDVCPTKTPEMTLVEVAITEVGMTRLTLDPATVRLRPTLPELDEDAIDAADLSVRACEQALEDLEEVLGLPDALGSVAALAAADLPERLGYTVRVADQWALVGTRSGFLHRQRWDRAAGICSVDESLDPRLDGRHEEADVDPAAYQTCPPIPDLLRYDTIDALVDPEARFENPSFALDILPPCEAQDDGTITLSTSQQDTVWTFAITGPGEASTLAVSDSILPVRVPLFDFRRQVVQIDAGANRFSLLQVRPGNPSVIVIFE